MDAGHYIPRHYHECKYDERNVHAQCAYCNRNQRGGMEIVYGMKVADKYGSDIKEALQEILRAKKPYKSTIGDLREMETKYKQLAKDMADIKNIQI